MGRCDAIRSHFAPALQLEQLITEKHPLQRGLAAGYL
jgi:hypothetical protein